MSKTKNSKIEINQETLAYRDVNSYRSIKPKKSKKSPSYFEMVRTGESYRKLLDDRQKWAKENQQIYVLPLNTANEARLIYYIDHGIPTVKPYITELIRKDMETHEIKYTKSWRCDYDNNVGTKRMFSLKFNKVKEADVIEHLENIKKQHISKRAYIIALLEKDIIDKKFKFPEELSEYNKQNKVIKDKLYDEYYKNTYYFLENELKKGNKTIAYTNMKKFIKDRMEINPNTLGAYWESLFKKPGVVTMTSEKGVYEINEEKFQEIINPIDIIK